MRRKHRRLDLLSFHSLATGCGLKVVSSGKSGSKRWSYDELEGIDHTAEVL